MRVSIAWLRTFCDPGLEPAALAERLTLHGLEVDALVPVPAPSEKIVTARLRDVVPVPRSNYKRIDADAGNEGRFSVISAAPNARPGMMGALALPGAYLPDGRLIGPRDYAGGTSEAMLCSAAEVALGDVSDRLLELPADAAAGVPLATLYALPDTCLDIDPTPNRGDCLSMLGIARELHATTGAMLAGPGIAQVAASTAERPEVIVDAPEACPRYLGRLVTLPAAGASTPIWLAERLRRAGLRASHPVVDVLNYVMLELGQPMHAFDADLLRGAIRVRRTRRGETLALLTGDLAHLDPGTLVIADDSGPVALAGILGGAMSAVRATTRRVLLESAFFAPSSIRGCARRMGLATEASHRFERGVDPALAARAIERATALLSEIAGSQAGPVSAVESATNLPRPTAIRFRPAELERLVGVGLGSGEIKQILGRLGFAAQAAEPGFLVTPPSFRFDVEGEADLVEELIRTAGYERIPAVAPVRRVAIVRRTGRPDLSECMAQVLRARGFDEALSLSFTDPDRDRAFGPSGTRALEIRNPLSALESTLRRSLWPGLVAALAHNAARQAVRVRLFERGPVFDETHGERRRLAGVASGNAWPEQWGVEPRPVDFYDAKGAIEGLLALAGVVQPAWVPSRHGALVPGRRARAEHEGRVIAELGVVAPEVAARWDIPAATVLFELDLDALPKKAVAQAIPVPRFPSVRRDLSLVVPDPVSAEALTAAVRRYGGPRLCEVRIFDTYSGVGIPSGTRSLGLGLIFRDLSRTLTDGEVDQAVSTIMTGLAEEMGAHVRN